MIEKSKVMAIVVTRGDVPNDEIEKIARSLIGFGSILFFDGVSADVVEDVNSKFAMQLLDRDMKVYGRYGAGICAFNERALIEMAANQASHRFEEGVYKLRCHQCGEASEHANHTFTKLPPLVLYVQDDDCVTDPEAILKGYQPGVVTCNMPPEFRSPVNDRGYAENPVHNITTDCNSALVGFGAVFDASLIIPTFQEYLETPDMKYDSLFLIECDRIFTALNYTKFVDVPVTQLAHAKLPGRLSTSADHDARYREVRRRIAIVGGK